MALELLKRPASISKILSANDTGETGGHQAGILIPKNREILSFFPILDQSTKNPRVKLRVTDPIDDVWFFSFIYYNNRYFGGTRDEYRLTGMTAFMKQHNLKSGDTIIFSRTVDNRYTINYKRADETNSVENDVEDNFVLKLGTSWKVINI